MRYARRSKVTAPLKANQTLVSVQKYIVRGAVEIP
jgi:hypothetical protein